MNPRESSELTVETLLALRQEEDAIRLITDRLGVKDMGPADHIRMKHEVKAFIESTGTVNEAEAILSRARERRTLQVARSVSLTQTERPGQRMSQ